MSLWQDFLDVSRNRYRAYRLEVSEPDPTELPPKILKSKKQPVLLVAGIFASGRMWLPFKQFLESRGYTVYLPPLKRNFADVPTLAAELAAQIQKLPAKKIQIVAHSLGGLTALAALQNPKIAAKVSQVITLGSPLLGCFFGTIYPTAARPWLKFNSAERSAWLRNSVTKKFKTFVARRDWIVFPASRAVLSAAAEVLELPVAGHLSLVLHPAVWAAVERRLV